LKTSPMQQTPRDMCEDRVQDGPASGEKGSKGRNHLDCMDILVYSKTQNQRPSPILKLEQKIASTLNHTRTPLCPCNAQGRVRPIPGDGPGEYPTPHRPLSLSLSSLSRSLARSLSPVRGHLCRTYTLSAQSRPLRSPEHAASQRKHGFSAEPVPVSESSKNLKDLKDPGCPAKPIISLTHLHAISKKATLLDHWRMVLRRSMPGPDTAGASLQGYLGYKKPELKKPYRILPPRS